LKLFYHESEEAQEAKWLEGRIIFTLGFPGNDGRAAYFFSVSPGGRSQRKYTGLADFPRLYFEKWGTSTSQKTEKRIPGKMSRSFFLILYADYAVALEHDSQLGRSP
jgi:hypothetical protein